MKFLSEVGHAGRRGTTLRSCPLNFLFFFYCGLEADEGGVDLPHTGQRQHDLSPVLWVLLYRVSFEVDRLQRLGVLQLVEVGPVVYLIIVHLGRIPRTIWPVKKDRQVFWQIKHKLKFSYFPLKPCEDKYTCLTNSELLHWFKMEYNKYIYWFILAMHWAISNYIYIFLHILYFKSVVLHMEGRADTVYDKVMVAALPLPEPARSRALNGTLLFY